VPPRGQRIDTHREEEVAVLGGAAALAFDPGALAWILSQEVEGEMAGDGSQASDCGIRDAAVAAGSAESRHRLSVGAAFRAKTVV